MTSWQQSFLALSIVLALFVGCSSGDSTPTADAPTSIPTAAPQPAAPPEPTAAPEPAVAPQPTVAPEPTVAAVPAASAEESGATLVERAARVLGPPLDRSVPAAERPEAQCLADAVLAEGIEGHIPDVASPFQPLPTIETRVAELGADCILALDLVGAMISDASLRPETTLVECLEAVKQRPETRSFLIRSIRDGEPSGDRPDFGKCLAEGGSAEQQSLLGADGRADPERIGEYLEAVAGFMPSDAELSCVADGIDSGAIAGPLPLIAIFRATPRCLSGATIAAGLGFDVTPEQAECVANTYPLIFERSGDQSELRVIAACASAEVFVDMWSATEGPITVDQAECMMQGLVDHLTVSQAATRCLEPA